jgi:hypothetical protein
VENNLRYFIKLYPLNEGAYAWWFISISSGKNRLIFLYHYLGPAPDKMPQEDESTHVVKVDFSASSSWEAETLSFYDNWTEKFPETDTIERLRLSSYVVIIGPGVHEKGQKVQWDNIVFESIRPDSDAAVVDVGFSGSPSAKVDNKGAVVVSFPVICDIFQGVSRIYSDTVNVDNLAVDSIKQVSFKSYSDTGEMKVYTALPGDQNPSNDTLNKNLGIQEVIVKKQLEFKVWPVLTKGMINYESDKAVIVYDPMGRFLVNGEKGKGRITFKAAGLYFLKSGAEVKKIVVE